MDNFIMNSQVEDFEEYTMNDYFAELNRIFMNAAFELLGYRRVSSYKSYVAAVQESYANADDEMLTFMSNNKNIVNFGEYLAFLEGLSIGMRI
jgi:hypothetical protein